jgi:two-component system cell cycle sensor histidine kinase/response regulator CckA
VGDPGVRPTTNLKSASTTVLVVDDEQEVLRVVETMLADYGYRIILARGADNAIRMFEQMAHKPDLILTDVVMPGMSGPMMVEHLQRIHPGIHVLFMSGYDDRQIVQKYVVQKGFALISKPFTPVKLATAVKDAVDVGQRSGELETAN